MRTVPDNYLIHEVKWAERSMRPKILARIAGIASLLGFVLAGQVLTASGEQLPLRHFGVAEGLPYVGVQTIFQDSKGYIWIGTAEGLSRFDGYHFTTYDTGDGLAHRFVNSITEDRLGRLWIATNGGGVSCFIDQAAASLAPARQGAAGPARRFISFRLGDEPGANRVNALIFDAESRLWCATDAGLFRSTDPVTHDDDVKFEVIVPYAEVETSMPAFADNKGRLWFGIADSLVEIVDKDVITYGPKDGLGGAIQCIVEDARGRLLVSGIRTIFEFREPPEGGGRGTWATLPLHPREHVTWLLVDRAGVLWIGTAGGLIRSASGKQTVYTTGNGLSDNSVSSLCEDRDGNLWIGTEHGGLCMLSAEPAISFGKADGLPDRGVTKVLEDQSGNIYASTERNGVFEVADRKTLLIQWTSVPPFNTIANRLLQDKHGNWWIGTREGLFRLQGSDLRQARGRKLTAADGLPETAILSESYDDRQDKLWMCTYEGTLYCIDPGISRGSVVAARIPLQQLVHSGISRLISDSTGALWIGSQLVLGRIVRGQASMIQPIEGLPEADPRAFFIDSRGWLWIGLRYKGVSVIRAPGVDPISFVNYSSRDGLCSNAVWSITEDDSGRIYLGTGRGLDRLDPTTGQIRHVTAGERLAGDLIGDCIKDSRGEIWVASTSGLTRLAPERGQVDLRGPPAYLTRLRVAGQEYSMPDAGTVLLPPLTLPPSRNNLLIEYLGLDYNGSRSLRYQYRLDGVDSDWGQATDQRMVNYASLAPGSYKFMVRALNQEGIASKAPAQFEFRILPPIWRRWWFIGLGSIMLAIAAYAAHRFRVSRLIELERVRTRIAADLHDDIGSGLSRIAILSEVAGHLFSGDDSEVKEPLSSIAATSRELVDSMSDIVWAINPNRDHLQDLAQRMRRFASDIFTARNIGFSFDAGGTDRPLRIGADVRRQIYLIFKEGVNNIARHSGCTRANIELSISDGSLLLELTDDGKGFDPASSSEGNGLASMRTRAERVGGELQVTSKPGAGTRIRMKASLSAQLRRVGGPSR